MWEPCEITEISFSPVFTEDKDQFKSDELVLDVENARSENVQQLDAGKIVKNEIENGYNGERRIHKYSGIIWAILGGLCFTVTSLLVKVLHNCDPINLTAWRYLGFISYTIPIWFFSIYVRKENIWGSIWPLYGGESKGKLKTLFFLFVSSLMSSTGITLIFCSLSFMSLADSTVVLFCGPIFVVIFAHFCLNEKCGIVTIPIALWTLLGVLIITRPPVLTGESGFSQDTLIGIGLCFGALLCISVYIILLRTLRQVHITLTFVFTGILGFIESVILAFMFGVLSIPKGAKDISITIAMSIIAFMAQTFIILALKFEEAGTVSMIRATDVIFAFLGQIMFLDVAPDLYSNIGAIIVIIGVLLTTFRKWLSTLPTRNWMRERFGFLLK